MSQLFRSGKTDAEIAAEARLPIAVVAEFRRFWEIEGRMTYAGPVEYPRD